jgi:hypothetical protein
MIPPQRKYYEYILYQIASGGIFLRRVTLMQGTNILWYTKHQPERKLNKTKK